MPDEEFERLAAPHRPELLAHCYRMLGSLHDAEDLVQETLLRAWRAYDRYDENRASLRTWLYRIATNACLTALHGRSRRVLPSGLVEQLEDPLAPLAPGGGEVPWLQPFPTDPATALVAKETLRLAFVAATQLLPARQRAILILREVLQWPAAEVAAALGITTAAVNSGLQRARARLGADGVRESDVFAPLTSTARATVDRYVTAFEAADVAGLAKLLTDDVVMEMPPVLNWYAGRDRYAAFMHRVHAMSGRDWRAVVTEANGQPAMAAYALGADGRYHAHTFQVLTMRGDLIARNTVYAMPALFPAFALPSEMTSTSDVSRTP